MFTQMKMNLKFVYAIFSLALFVSGFFVFNKVEASEITGTVTILGTAKYGETLTADISQLMNAGSNPRYQWTSHYTDTVNHADDITGATNPTFKLTFEEIGKTISVTVRPEIGVGTGTITSSDTEPVSKLDQSISINNVPNVVYGTTAQLTISSEGGDGAVTYSTGDSTGCSVLGDILSVTNASGTCSVIATKEASQLYNKGISEATTIGLQKAEQIIAWGNPADITYGEPLSAVQLNAISDKEGTSPVYTPDTGTVLDAGNSQVLSVTFSSSDNYNSATKNVNINVNKKPITITAVPNAKTIDGNTTSAATPIITSGELVGEDTPNFTQSYADATVGENKILTPAGIVNDENEGNNYAYTYVSVNTGKILPAKKSTSKSSSGSYIIMPTFITNPLPTPVASTPTPEGSVLGSEKYNFTMLLKKGSENNEVMELQKLLISLGFNCTYVDGKYGPLTKSAVIKFQIANKLEGDGIVGEKTRAILNK